MSADDGDSDSHDETDPRMTALIAGLTKLSPIVRADDLEPSWMRNDWSVHRERLAELRRIVFDEVLPVAEAALAINEVDTPSGMRRGCADELGAAAGLLYVAGERDAAAQVLAGAASVGKDTEQGARAAEGLREPESFARLNRAWWLLRHDRRAEARVIAHEFADVTRLPAIAASAKQIIEDREPQSQASTSWRWLLLALVLTAMIVVVVMLARR